MKWPFAILLLLIVIAVFVLLVYLRIAHRPAFRQNSKEVVIREPGERYLGAPQPVRPEAQKDQDFARLSESAYEKMKADKSRQTSTVSAVDTALRGEGWVPWPNFPDDGLQQEIVNAHLRVQVWTNPSRDAVAVAFGGTVLESGKDWRSNFRWFIPHHEDEYTEIVRRFAPAFATEFLKRKEQREWAFLQHASIYATGHSLGGGLAQQFAYSLPKNPTGPHVAQVFAFDPSPVTGYYSVEKSIREYNERGLKIDRIYERGEVLAILRSLTNFLYKPSAANPTVRHVRYALFCSSNPITGHSIADLTRNLEAAAR
jgi:hypothetical protein